jgi:tetratricopeptide (TPR) repeat protein
MPGNMISATSGNFVQAGKVIGGVHLHAAGESHTVPRQLPRPARGFVGRDELLALLDEAASGAIAGEPDAAGVLVLSGMAGVGKTALAIRWAYRTMSAFPDGQLCTDLSGYGVNRPVNPSDVLAGFLRALGVPAELVPAELVERTAKFRSILSERRVLVVLDNASSEQQVRPLLPGTGSCVVIVTSRSDLTGLIVDQGAELIHVDLLATDDALDVLRALISPRVRAEPLAAAQLVQQCAHLPLALRVVSGMALTRPTKTLTELADALADEHARLELLDIREDPRTAVRSVFSWSYRYLSPEAARLFRLLGLAPGSTGIHAVAALANIGSAAVDHLVRTLLRAQLLHEPRSNRVEMHDLMRMYAAELAERHEGEDARRAAVIRLFDYYLHTAEQADRIVSPNRFRVPLDGTAWPGSAFGNRAQAVSWLTVELAAMTALMRLEDPAFDNRRWQLAYTLRGFFFLTKDWDTWIETHRLALVAAERLGDPYAQASTHNNLGLALLERGAPGEAEAHYLAAKSLFQQLGDLRGLGNTLGNLAWVLHARSDHEGALALASFALNNYQQAGARTNLGITLHSIAVFEVALHRYGEAREHLECALAIFDERRSRLNMSMALNYLGEFYRRDGDTASGEQAHRRALAIAREQGSRYQEANACKGLGYIALLRNDLGLAEQQWQRAADVYGELAAMERHDMESELASLRARTEAQ